LGLVQLGWEYLGAAQPGRVFHYHSSTKIDTGYVAMDEEENANKEANKIMGEEENARKLMDEEEEAKAGRKKPKAGRKRKEQII